MQVLKNAAAFRYLLNGNKKINLILLNIDNFSSINDFYGVESADNILKYIEDALKRFNFKNIDVYNFEADEFALVSETFFDVEESIEIANEINSFFTEAGIELENGSLIYLSLSIGIAIGSGLQVLSHAHLAIKELREHTRGTYKVYDESSPFIQSIKKNVYWVNKIQESVAEGNVIAFFQPIFNNKTKKIEKYECLARIEDNGKLESPYHFMDAVKATRVISFITKNIIKQACKMFSSTEYAFSINITNADLQLGYLEEYLLRNAGLYNIRTDRIILELLEDISSLDKGTTLEQLKSLKEKGFKLAIDDFGSESSNFSRFLEFKPDYLKIDGVFIKNILTDERSQVITQTIVSFAHKMDIEMIAEFVHSEDVQKKMEELGIDYSQGYLHGKPLRTLKEV